MHTVTEIEERIRQRYRQPKGVEQFGIEPIPPELKTVRWHDIFAIIFQTVWKRRFRRRWQYQWATRC